MTDGIDQAIARSGLELLSRDENLTVCDGYVPDGTPRPYVLVYTHVEWPNSLADSLVSSAGAPTTRWYCHCVGDTAVASIAVAQRVRAALLNARPNLTGVSVPVSLGLISQESSQPPVRDETTGQLVIDTVVTYRLMAAT